MSSLKLCRLFLCFVVMITSALRSETGARITCSAGRFELGHTATVTCFFHKDVGATKAAFDMTVIYFDASGNTDISIVNCNWFPNGTLHCLVKDGFVLRDKDNLKSNLTVDIPTFTGNHTGVYKCHVIDDETPTEPCYLLNTLVYPSPQSASSGSSETVGYIVGLIVLVVALVSVIVAWLLTNRQRRRRKKASTENAPMLPDEQAARQDSSLERDDTPRSRTENNEVDIENHDDEERRRSTEESGKDAAGFAEKSFNTKYNAPEHVPKLQGVVVDPTKKPFNYNAVPRQQ